MDNAVNNRNRPLLQQSETDSAFEDDLQEDRSENLDNEVVVVNKDSKPLFMAREPNGRSNKRRTAMVCGQLCTAPENDYYVTCSFDKEHVVLRSRLPYHILKCLKNHPNHNKVQCPYNACEYIDEKDLADHLHRCEDQRSIYMEKFEAGRLEKHGVNISLMNPTPYIHESSPICDEEWGPSGNDDADEEDDLVAIGRGVNLKLNVKSVQKVPIGRGRATLIGHLKRCQIEKEHCQESQAFFNGSGPEQLEEQILKPQTEKEAFEECSSVSSNESVVNTNMFSQSGEFIVLKKGVGRAKLIEQIVKNQSERKGLTPDKSSRKENVSEGQFDDAQA